ncbi:MAG: hypothetical protein M1268_00425 [Patescibacteria group bacterium]|nr:hypothetical protein [Patescibacteria group bacterium]
MLTKNDLMQIKTIVKGEVEPVEKAVGKLDQRVGSLDQRFSSLDQKVSRLGQTVTGLDQKVNRLDQKLDRAQEDISVILTEVIKHHDVLEKRVDRIEDHLDLPKLQ